MAPGGNVSALGSLTFDCSRAVSCHLGRTLVPPHRWWVTCPPALSLQPGQRLSLLQVVPHFQPKE